MATTKHQIAEQALRMLSGGDVSKDSEITIREMMLAVSQARDFVIRQELWQLIAMGDVDVVGEYICSYEDEPVLFDDKRDMFYSEIPAEYINLPRNMGVYQISLMKDQFNAFVPVSSSFLSMHRGMASQNLNGQKGYLVEKGRVYYTGLEASDDIEKVLIKLVAASSEIEEDDIFPIPADKEMEVIKMAVQMYSTQLQIPNDQVNDNQK
jgi:hypothetical protein